MFTVRIVTLLRFNKFVFRRDFFVEEKKDFNYSKLEKDHANTNLPLLTKQIVKLTN